MKRKTSNIFSQKVIFKILINTLLKVLTKKNIFKRYYYFYYIEVVSVYDVRIYKYCICTIHVSYHILNEENLEGEATI